MLQKTDKGKQARQYFIEVEKEYKTIITPPTSLDLLETQLKLFKEQQAAINVLQEDVKMLQAKTTIRPEYFTLMKYDFELV